MFRKQFYCPSHLAHSSLMIDNDFHSRFKFRLISRAGKSSESTACGSLTLALSDCQRLHRRASRFPVAMKISVSGQTTCKELAEGMTTNWQITSLELVV